MKENNNVLNNNVITLENKLEIIDEGIRKRYLSRLKELTIKPFDNLLTLEDDIINNIRLYRITEMVYKKGESATDKFTTVFNTLSTYDALVFVVIDSNGIETNFYLGVRSNEREEYKRSMVALGDTLKNTLIGNFPGVKLQNEDRKKIEKLSKKIIKQNNVASVSVVGNEKIKDNNNEQFIQGLEKLALALSGRQYIGIIIAENQNPKTIQGIRKNYQELYTKLSPFARVQIAKSKSESLSRSKSFFEMDGKQRAAMIGGVAVSLAGVIGGAFIDKGSGAIVGGQVASQLNGFINSLAPNEQISSQKSESNTTTYENKTVIDLLTLINENLKNIDIYDSYGMWNVAGYFLSDDMSTAEIAASNYRSLMNGDKSGREVSAINSWKKNDENILGNFEDLTSYLSRYYHPLFDYGGNIYTDASTSVSGKELGLHLGLPRMTVPGLPVIEHAEFGKEVNVYRLFNKKEKLTPEEKMTLGKVFDLGQITNKIVELDNRSLNMHTFITGSTGSGKSNCVYQILNELKLDKIPFLVIEPAKGEYKDVFGHMEDVNVYSTNPNISELININPFKFPKSIHVLEHIDGLVEIFNVCWPMYDAMSSFLKEAILKSYESVGWDLGSSTFEGKIEEYPNFETILYQLNNLIDSSEYSSEVKSNYRGALLTRVKSLTVGLNKFIFTAKQTDYKKLFDENCILDISRVKSSETKALLMGLMVFILNEYRIDQKKGSNNTLKHITVMEEAHNLLKNCDNSKSELVNKSIEIITNTIAEIRTYGEGFIIVDQSPSSVDIAAIKNTNTKIVLRTPEANDRVAIGHSIGLTEEQVNEIAKLPSGVAIVYQNDWINPVLTMIDKAKVKEIRYIPKNKIKIPTLKDARSKIVRMLMQPWINGGEYSEKELNEALQVLEITNKSKKVILRIIEDYCFYNNQTIWKEADLMELCDVLRDIFKISLKEINNCKNINELVDSVSYKINNFTNEEINEVCNKITFFMEDK